MNMKPVARANFRRVHWQLTLIFALVSLMIIAAYSGLLISGHRRARYNFELNVWKDLGRDSNNRPFVVDERCLSPQPPYDAHGRDSSRSLGELLAKNMVIFDRHIYVRLLVFDALVWCGVCTLGYFFIGWLLRPVQEAMVSQEQFLANASHELKTPITTIKTELSLLSLQKMSSDVRSSLATIKTETESLQQLVEKLLMMVSLNKEVETLEEADLSVLCQSLVSRWQKNYAARNLEFVWHGPKRCLCRTRERSLERVLNLLLDNAGKYADEGSKVELVLRDNSDAVEFLVINQGVGIPLEQQDKIWKRFYRVTDRRVQAETGSGLGLAIAHELAASVPCKLFLTDGLPEHTEFQVILEKSN